MSPDQATALSDGLLALAAFALAAWSWQRRAISFLAGPMTGTFVAHGFAAVLGGMWHAWEQSFPPAASFWLWKATLVAVGLGDACLLAALARAPAPRRHERALRTAIWAKLGAYLVFAAFNDAYLIAVIDQGLTLLAGLAVLAWDATHERSLPAAWLVGAIVLAVTAGVVQATSLELGRQLNHNVLYHLVALLALVAFGRAATLGPKTANTACAA